MRTFVTVVLSVLGGLLLLVGGAVAVVVGPDDTASLPAADVPAASGVALTSYDLFPLRDLTLHVSATSASGDVFLGVAHPVDARDYVAGVSASRVTGVERTGAITTGQTDGDLDAPEVPPTSADFWLDAASGAGAVSLDVPLTDEPVAFVVAPADGPARTTLAFGVVLPRIFQVALAVAGTGLLLVVAAVLVRRGRRRPGLPRTSEPVVGHAPEHGTDDTGVPQAATTGSRTTPAGSAPRAAAPPPTRLRAAVAGLGAAATLTACVPLPSAAQYPDPPTRLAVEEAEIQSVLTSFGERRSAASARAAERDPQAWENTHADAELAYLQFAGALDEVRGVPTSTSTIGYTVRDAAVRPHDSYPMSFVALLDVTVDDGEPEPRLHVFERDRATSPWRTSFALTVPADTVDLPGFGQGSVPTPEQVEAGTAALEHLRTYLETGAEVPLDPGELAGFRDDVLTPIEGQRSAALSDLVPFGAPEDPTAPAGPVQVVPVADGVLVTASYTYVHRQDMEPGWTARLMDEAVAQVTGQTGDRESIRLVGVVQAVLLVPADGSPARVLAAGTSLITPRV